MTDRYATQSYAAAVGSAPSANPVLSITTEASEEITSKEVYLNATMALTGVPGQADIYDTLRIRGRGNLTWTLPKKPFKLKLDNSQPMLGMTSSKDWALLANWYDHSSTNTPLADQLGYLSPGLTWTPHYGFVDLFLNGTYQGAYQLIESVTVASSRVNITKASGTSGLTLTGGYLLEVSNTAQDDDPSFTTTNGTRILYDDPDGTVTEQSAYIAGWVQDFEDVLYGVDFDDPDTGYRAWIDVPSFIGWYLVEELSKNDQAPMTTSAKCYKNRDTAEVLGKLHMGPLWDFDESFGVNNAGTQDPTGFKARPADGWFDRLFDDPTFLSDVRTAWAALKTAITGAGGINKMIDRAIARTASAQIRDGGKWGYDPDWAGSSSFKKTWLAARMAWLDTQYGDVEPEPGYSDAVLADNPISYWRLGETSGTTATDEMGANNGTYTGGVGLGTTGLTTDGDKAVTLDGTNDYIMCKTGPIISGLTNWTIEAIVKPIDGNRILYGERGSSGLDILEVEVKALTNLTYRDHAGNINQPAVSTSALYDGNAHHIVITKAGTAVKFYEDGVLNGSATLTATDTFGEATTQSWIGADPTGAQFYHGVIDEVALYNVALSDAQVAAHNAAR